MSGKLSELKEKPGFSYFISTPCEDWDALEYHREWQAKKYEMSKTKVKTAITRQLEWFMENGSKEEKSTASRTLKQFQNDSNSGGRIHDFWAVIFADEKADFKQKLVDAKVREIQSDKCLIMNKRSLDVLKETVVEHNEASVTLADFARDGQDVRKRRKQYHQLDGYTTPSPDPVDDLHMGETNVSLLFRNYQNQSLNIARDKGLFVESN
ncbi:3715_t:CDS:2, partial [Acaulospora morrowiae]